jgi:hypothetical protein
MTEKWKPVVGYEGFYEVSDLGRVKALRRLTRNGRTRSERILIHGFTQGGYPKVDLSRDNTSHTKLVHRLVLEAFVGPANGLHACHGNGVRVDNQLANLRWGTISDNAIDRNEHSKDTEQGHASPRAILTADDVRFIRASGYTPAELRRLFPQVKEAALAHVRSGRTWKHIK